LIWISSSSMRMGSVAIAERKAEVPNVPVWMYLFEWRSPAVAGRVRSAHGVDTPFIFGVSDLVPACQGPDEPALKKLMSSAWSTFARTGSPETAEQSWPSYEVRRRTTLCINNPAALVDDPYAEERQLWGVLGSSGMGISP
jgi:para-nitrobenzyl esterase